MFDPRSAGSGQPCHAGKLLFQAVRYEPKKFLAEASDGRGGWVNNFHRVERVLYNLKEVIEADQVIILEEEKDVETLRDAGLTATCNPMGAGK